jgi:hypothetical protein
MTYVGETDRRQVDLQGCFRAVYPMLNAELAEAPEKFCETVVPKGLLSRSGACARRDESIVSHRRRCWLSARRATFLPCGR